MKKAAWDILDHEMPRIIESALLQWALTRDVSLYSESSQEQRALMLINVFKWLIHSADNKWLSEDASGVVYRFAANHPEVICDGNMFKRLRSLFTDGDAK